jgi:hypothetical protein
VLLSTNCRLRYRLSQACHRTIAKNFAQRRKLRIMRRHSPNVSLSAAEVSSLRRVASGLAKFLSSDVRELLMSMGLISLSLGGRLVLTEEGKRRLTQETARPPARAQTLNPFDVPPGG